MTNLSDMRTDIPNLSYKEIDKLVAIYQTVGISEAEKDEALNNLLTAFHKYFMKYARLLKGEINYYGSCIKSSDTLEFLSLFNSISDRQNCNTWYVSVYNFIHQTCQHLDKDDIYNELCVKFIELLDAYKVYEGTSFARYITKYLRWNMKAWVVSMAKELRATESIDFTGITDESTCEESTNMLDLPEIDIQWILDPNSNLFSILSSYERFLLYLNFKENLGTRQIGKRLGRGKDTIHRHIREALDKLKQEANKRGV